MNVPTKFAAELLLVTLPSTPPRGFTVTVLFVVLGFSGDPLLETPTPDTEYSHPVE